MGTIYKITNTKSANIYIGATTNLRKRKNLHIHRLREGIHHSKLMQNDFLLYGEECFVFSKVEENIQDDQLLIRELYFIHLLQPQYNSIFTNKPRNPIQKKAPRIKVPTKNTRLSERIKEYYKNLSPEERALRNAYKKGKVFSEETKLKLSNKRLGKKHPDSTKSKISKSVKNYFKSKNHATNFQPPAFPE